MAHGNYCEIADQAEHEMSHIMKYSYYSFIFLYFTFFDFDLHQILPFDKIWAFFFYYVMPLASIDASFMALDELRVVEDGNIDNRCKMKSEVRIEQNSKLLLSIFLHFTSFCFT